MLNLNTLSLEEKIKYFIESKIESEFWDFKVKWPDSPYSLIKDVISFSNSIYLDEAYIIIGVSNNFKVDGLKDEEANESITHFNDTFSKAKFAGNNKPSYRIKHVYIENKRIDVIIINNSLNTPFYLIKDIMKNDNVFVHANKIYSQNGDSNSNDDYYIIEKLWKKGSVYCHMTLIILLI